MHAPSVGEGLQARPVLEAIRRAHAETQLAYTYFSPSAERFAESLDVDFRAYLPFDTSAAMTQALMALTPTALVYSKGDVWPLLTELARRRHVALGMISATLSEGSARAGRMASLLLRDAYAALDRVGAVGDSDRERLIAQGVRPAAITVTGDTRYDQVWARATAADRNGPLLSPLRSERPTLVAGSTWPADEQPLLSAWGRVARHRSRPRLVIAPHEPTREHLDPVDRWATRAGLALARLGAARADTADIILVDRIGVLGDLYSLADAAFVGGGFHRAGLHSVLEPAAFGAPVLFGPRHDLSRDARALIDAGGAVSVPGDAALEERLLEWLEHPELRRAAGERAREVVAAGLGAAVRSTALVTTLLEQGSRNR